MEYIFYQAVFNLIFCCLLGAAAWEYLKRRRIPHGLGAGVACLGIWKVFWEAGDVSGLAEGLVDSLGGVCFGMGVFLVILLIRPGAFGGGDVKLLAAGGVYLGVERTAVAFGLSILLAGGYCLIAGKLRKERGRQIAFAPFLGAGMALSCFFGEMLWKWYIG